MLERTSEALDHVRRGLRLSDVTGQSPFIPGLLVLETNALFMQGRIAPGAAGDDRGAGAHGIATSRTSSATVRPAT
jgi:hypothetical protein